MKSILKSFCPETFEKWTKEHPDAVWDDMRSDNPDGDTAYKDSKKVLFNNQHGLCAYCECKLDKDRPHCSRIEHFHPKSDRSDINWDFIWDNLLLVCLGGENEKEKHPLPENLSCDASKKDMLCDDIALNPINLPPYPVAFLVNKGNGELYPNQDFCDAHPHISLQTSTYEMLKNTLSIYNLNCNRLCSARLVVIREMEKQKAKKRESNIPITEAINDLAEMHLQIGRPFFSTRRAYLGAVAEEYLKRNDFRG